MKKVISLFLGISTSICDYPKPFIFRAGLVDRKNIFLLSFLIVNSAMHAQCDSTNSPTFQVVISQVTLATNGISSAQIQIINAAANPPGSGVILSLMAPGQFTVPPGTTLNVAGIYTASAFQLPSNCATSQTMSKQFVKN